MASATRDDRNEGEVFERKDNNRITARDLETKLARGGDTRTEALAQLAEVLELEAGGGEPITGDDLEVIGLDFDDGGDKGILNLISSWSGRRSPAGKS